MYWNVTSFDIWLAEIYYDDSVLPTWTKRHRKEFEEESWFQWAVRECQRRVHEVFADFSELSTLEILEILDKFSAEIFEYAGENERTRRMYLIIYNAILNVANLFEVLGGCQ